MVRLFIALPLSNETKEKLYAHMLNLKLQHIQGSWVKKENLHVTLKFLGHTEEHLIPELDNVLTSIANETTTIKSEIKNIDAFPSLRNPRVIFFNLEDTGKIAGLFGKIDAYSPQWGVEKETRPFTTHITFCRPKQRYDLTAPYIQSLLVFPPTKETFQEVILYKSLLTSSGAVYEVVRAFPFHL